MGVFSKVGGAFPSRTRFNLSYNKLYDTYIGQLVPVCCDEMIPGDSFKISAQAVIRLNPTIAPIMQQLDFYSYYFFVPYRLLWDKWEKYITGGQNGNDSSVLPTVQGTTSTSASLTPVKYSLVDYLGIMQPSVAYSKAVSSDKPTTPMDMPLRAFELIWNEYFRDENLDTVLPYKMSFDSSEDQLSVDELSSLVTSVMPYVCWGKDYFTSALPWQQRGTAPALPISGTTSADFNGTFFINSGSTAGVGMGASSIPFGSAADKVEMFQSALTTQLNNNSVDLSNASTFDVADLRLAFQLQKWLERNARGGVRYTEFLKAQYGTSPRDDRMQRPEYIGGFKQPIIVSEVLQTSETTSTSPQGNLAGKGISVGGSYVGKYYSTEFGLIMGLAFIRPKTSYQNGCDRQWLRKSRYDFYNPLFANLSEQAILRGEIYQSGASTDYDESLVQGFTGRYNEMRKKSSIITSDFRDTYDYWHMGRQFATAPNLNSAFVHMQQSDCIRDFAVQNEPTCLVDYANIIDALRPMPYIAEPGLIDHH